MRQLSKSEFTEELNRQAGYEQKTLDKWAERFAKDPGYAFEWADDAMKSAAKLAEVQRLQVLVIREDMGEWDEQYAELQKYLTGEVMRGARYGKSSTSQPASVMAQRTLQAQAELLETFFGVR